MMDNRPPPFGLTPSEEMCSACYNKHPEPYGDRCPVIAWETVRRQLADLVETMDAGVLPTVQSLVIRGHAELMAVEFEQAARVIALRGDVWARAIEPDRPPAAGGLPTF
jgi:hypothetical protein